MTISEMSDSDVGRAYAINQDAAPAVDSVSEETFQRLARQSAIRLVALDATGTVVGFCLVAAAGDPGLPPRAAAALDRDDAALHLERVAFARGGGGQGLGPKLYDELDTRIESSGNRFGAVPIALTSWFSVEPLNQHAYDFYLSRGFVEVERQPFGDTTLALMKKLYRP